MDIGGDRYAAVGRVHAVPVADTDGTLILCGLDAIGPDPVTLIDVVEADIVVCLQTDVEIERRFPDYLRWLSEPDPHAVIRLPTADYLVTDDDEVAALVVEIHARLHAGQRVVVHCGAGWGRAGVIAVLVMCAAGSDVPSAVRDLRAARPAAGPESVHQNDQVERLAQSVRATVAGHSSP